MIFIHPTAEVSSSTDIGENTKIWHNAQIRENTKIGSNCIIAKGVYIDTGTKIGNNVKIQNYASVYHFTIIEDGVFIGPYVCTTNDKLPRAITPNGKLKTDDDWEVNKTIIKKGASLGAGSIILPGITIGEYALVGAGSLVTKDILAHSLMYGSPAKLQGFVCKCGKLLTKHKRKPKILICNDCQKL